MSYVGKMVGGEHHRYRSWEHCYRFFQQTGHSQLATHQQDAALQLGFYLASWGMYRGRSFLLQHAYTIHLAAVDCLADPRWSKLWETEFGANDSDEGSVSDIVELRKCLGAAYRQFGEPTDTLVTKIMLGTIACSPACDRYFIEGFKSEGYAYSSFNRQFLTDILQFCRENPGELRSVQKKIEKEMGIRYPLMKLVDMCFFQAGVEGTA